MEDFEDFGEEEAFLDIFDELNEDNWKDVLGKGEDPGDYAYSLQIVNTEKKSYYSNGVEFFGHKNFDII